MNSSRDETRAGVVADLRELVRALDNRVMRPGGDQEAQIAGMSAALRTQAIDRIAGLTSEPLPEPSGSPSDARDPGRCVSPAPRLTYIPGAREVNTLTRGAVGAFGANVGPGPSTSDARTTCEHEREGGGATSQRTPTDRRDDE